MKSVIKRHLIKNAQHNFKVLNPIWRMMYPFVRKAEMYRGDEYEDRASAFQTIYAENRWQSEESRSGSGSTLSYTIPLRLALAKLVDKLGVTTFLDAPCGDFNWIRHVAFGSDVKYIGGDLVPELVNDLQEKYSSPTRRFIQLDIVNGEIPKADLWLCRDVLFHLPNADVSAVLAQAARSECRYFLSTTYPFIKANEDVRAGGFRFINLRKPPFNLPKPLMTIDDFMLPHPPRVLGLWSFEQLAAAQ